LSCINKQTIAKNKLTKPGFIVPAFIVPANFVKGVVFWSAWPSVSLSQKVAIGCNWLLARTG